MSKYRKNSPLGRFWQHLCKFSVQFITTLQCSAVLLLWGCAASVYVSPAEYSILSILTLGFPFLLAGALAVGFVALVFTPRRVWITLVGLIGCFGSLRNYAPLNLPSTPPDGSYHVMSWNIGGAQWNDSATTALKDFLLRSDLDLLILQEASSSHTDTLAEALRSHMSYSLYQAAEKDECGLAVLSRWPIVDHQVLCHNGGNSTQVFSLLMGEADTLLVVNCHLQSLHLTPSTRTEYKAIVKREQTNRDSMEQTSKTLIQQIRENSIQRALQTDTIVRFLQEHQGTKLIVAGDFNDTPISYPRQQIVEAVSLADAFREKGQGIGRSFNRDAIYVRIDHLFFSPEHWDCYLTRVAPTTLSDHNPIDTYLSKKP